MYLCVLESFPYREKHLICGKNIFYLFLSLLSYRPNPKSYQLFPFFIEELSIKFGVDGTYRFFTFVCYTMYFVERSAKIKFWPKLQN